MIHYSDPPVLLRDVVEDMNDVVGLLERNAPYTPLGGWFRPGVDLDAAIDPLWFQNDWVHEDLKVEGSDLFLWHERYHQGARDFYGAEVVVPQSLYVNLMAAIDAGGPAHTDNPKFHGRSRANTPMWLLRSMLWSGLFDRWNIAQATAIWWMSDVEGGGLYYWADGPGKPPHHHYGDMANTTLLGDNHGMFHQVAPVGPFDAGTIRVTQRAELAPLDDGSGDWAVMDRGEVVYRAPLETYRVSVLWKADVYPTEEARQRASADTLAMEDVARVFNADLDEKRAGLQLDLERLEDPGLTRAINEVYPEARPVAAAGSIYDA